MYQMLFTKPKNNTQNYSIKKKQNKNQKTKTETFENVWKVINVWNVIENQNYIKSKNTNISNVLKFQNNWMNNNKIFTMK